MITTWQHESELDEIPVGLLPGEFDPGEQEYDYAPDDYGVDTYEVAPWML